MDLRVVDKEGAFLCDVSSFAVESISEDRSSGKDNVYRYVLRTLYSVPLWTAFRDGHRYFDLEVPEAPITIEKTEVCPKTNFIVVTGRLELDL